MRTLSLLVALAACGSTPVVGPQELDMALKTARDNALYNAKLWRASNTMFSTYDIMARGDSSQTPECPQGDGWATMELVDLDSKTKVTIKCSTWSAGKGCIDSKHFQTTEDAMSDKMCQPTTSVPYPLPTIAQ